MRVCVSPAGAGRHSWKHSGVRVRALALARRLACGWGVGWIAVLVLAFDLLSPRRQPHWWWQWKRVALDSERPAAWTADRRQMVQACWSAKTCPNSKMVLLGWWRTRMDLHSLDQDRDLTKLSSKLECRPLRSSVSATNQRLALFERHGAVYSVQVAPPDWVRPPRPMLESHAKSLIEL